MSRRWGARSIRIEPYVEARRPAASLLPHRTEADMADRLTILSHQLTSLALRQPRVALGGSVLGCIVALELIAVLL